MAKIGGACKEIVANWFLSDTGCDPLARVYPLPVDGKVHMVNCRVTRVGRIGVGSKGDNITNGISVRAEPGASRFDSRRMGRVGNMHKKSDTNDNEDEYEQDRTQEREFMFYGAL